MPTSFSNHAITITDTWELSLRSDSLNPQSKLTFLLRNIQSLIGSNFILQQGQLQKNEAVPFAKYHNQSELATSIYQKNKPAFLYFCY